MFWVETASNWMLVTNPYDVWMELTGRVGRYYWRGGRPPLAFWGFNTMSYSMAGAQAVLGVLFLAVAIAGLRPLRGSSWPGSQSRTGWWGRLRGRIQAWEKSRTAAAVTRNELLATRSRRPPCGDNPMRWKERHTTMGGGLRWLGGRPMMLFFSVLLGCYLLDMAAPVVEGIARGHVSDQVRLEMNGSILASSIALAILGMIAVAAAAAVSVTEEREQDTWVSLATTLLTPEEIVRAKQFGAIWSARRIWLALLILWSFGATMGAMHPFVFLAAGVVLALASWFIAAAGVFISARSTNSTRALTITLLAVFMVLSSVQAFSLEFFRQPAVIVALPAAAALAFTYLSIRRVRATWGKA